MDINTVNISFKKDLLKKIDKVAEEESRSRSELIREAARMYIDRKSRWKEIFKFGEAISFRNKLKEKEILEEIKAYRRVKR